MNATHNKKFSDSRFRNVVLALAILVILASFIVIMAMKQSFSVSVPRLRPISSSFTPLIYGRPKGDVRSVVTLSQGWNWDTCVYFRSTRPDSTNDWWLGVTNRIGCQLHLWGSDGSEIYSKKPDVSAAFHVPKQATMSNILVYIRHSRGRQIPEHLWIDPDGVSQAYRFQLGDLFLMQFSQEYLLEITPMLYKARINMLQIKALQAQKVSNVQINVLINQTPADLVEFPPLILKLLTNGNVVSLEAMPQAIKP